MKRLATLTLAAVFLAHAASAQTAHAPPLAAGGMGHDMDGMNMMGGGSMVVTTSPVDGDTFKGSPPAFSITFAHPMRLSAVRLVNDLGETIKADFKAQGEDALQAVAPLPQLPPGQYELHWVATMGSADARGVVKFSVQ